MCQVPGQLLQRAGLDEGRHAAGPELEAKNSEVAHPHTGCGGQGGGMRGHLEQVLQDESPTHLDRSIDAVPPAVVCEDRSLPAGDVVSEPTRERPAGGAEPQPPVHRRQPRGGLSRIGDDRRSAGGRTTLSHAQPCAAA